MSGIPPLIRLMDGKRARPRKAPTVRPLESSVHFDVARVLADHPAPDWLSFHPANGEFRDIRTAVKLKRMGVRPGVPDFVLIAPDGSVRFLELKRRGEKLREAQEKFWRHCVQRGIPYRVARTFDEALAALDHWGCLRIKIGGAR